MSGGHPYELTDICHTHPDAIMTCDRRNQQTKNRLTRQLSSDRLTTAITSKGHDFDVKSSLFFAGKNIFKFTKNYSYLH